MRRVRTRDFTIVVFDDFFTFSTPLFLAITTFQSVHQYQPYWNYSHGSLSWVLLLHPSFVILSLSCSLSVRLTRIARIQIKRTIASINSKVCQKIVKLLTGQDMFIKWRNISTNWQCFSGPLHQEIDFPQCWCSTMAFWANCRTIFPSKSHHKTISN